MVVSNKSIIFIVCNKAPIKLEIMSKLRNKVEARLLKGGFNPSSVATMMDEQFDYASSKYTGVARIADVVSTLWSMN